MAERRMFAKSVIGSARFLRMSPTSRLLYYDLGMAADDDGIVEAFSVMRTTGASEEDLCELASKGFVRVINDDFVTYITDWSRNNYIQKDRYHPSIYHELLVKIADASEMDTECIQTVSRMDTQVRLGKDRIGKESLGEGMALPAAPAAFIPEEDKKGCEAAKRPAHSPFPPPSVGELEPTGFGPEVSVAFDEWLRYKQERREAYKSTGLKALISHVRNQAEIYGEKAVADCIRLSMSNGWKGIVFDRLEKAKARPDPSGQKRKKTWADLAREMREKQDDN